MTEVEQQPPPQNGIDLSAAEEDDSSKARPADIEQDMREMERRKRVEAIMGSKLFREELERIVDSARDGGGILQQLSDIMGVPTSTRVGNVFKATNCMLPINDIRGVESMGYAKGEKILRCKLAATFRLLDLYGWTQGLGAQITARLKVDQENFLVNPYGMMYHEITASSLNRVDMQGQIVEQGTTNFGVNKTHFALHSVVHAARPDIRCAIYIGCTPVVAVSSLKVGLLPITRDACVLGEVTTHTYTGTQMDSDERDRLVRALGPNSKVLILSNYGALCCGETIEEAFFAASHIVKACETQLQLLPVGVDNLVLIPEESRKAIYIEARRPPEDLEKKFAAAVATVEAANAEAAAGADGTVAAKSANAGGAAPKWRVGGAEFEALMRMLDNAGYRTGYIYRHPLIKSDPPKPKNDVELPPAVSSLGYLLEEEELIRQGIWKKGDFRKGGDRSRWLNSPNVYQKVEVLETGTPDPKKITKWVAEGSPTHSTPVRIDDALQFVPPGTNPKEFKRLQQQIKDNRRADKISAGPQSHILEGVTWDEAARIKDATVSSAGDHVVLMGAASKGIIQRGYQHNAAVYKAPYAKNPFDNVTDDELNEYKRTVERKKKSIHGEYTDTDFSESEPLSSMPISAPQQTKQTTITTAGVSQSEPEDVSAHQVMRIQTQQAPIPSQPEVVLSDATLSFINGERSHTAVNRKPPTGRDIEYPEYEDDENYANSLKYETIVENTHSRNDSGDKNHSRSLQRMQRVLDDHLQQYINQSNKENIHCGNQNIKRNNELIAELKKDVLFQKQKHKLQTSPRKKYEMKECTIRQGQNSLVNRMLRFGVSSDNYIENCGGGGGGGGVSGRIEFVVSGSPCQECFAGGADQTQSQRASNVETLGFRPIHPIEPRADVNETVTQQPQFCYADANNNKNNDECGCQHQHQHHHHHQPHAHTHHHHHHQCQHMGTGVGIVALPNFEQAFGHLLSRPTTTDSCALYYDNYAPVYDSTQYAADSTRTASIDSTAAADMDEAENPFKKSLACCTPAVCDSIFESLRKPHACNDNNLIFNIPFTAEMADTTTTTNTSASTPRKTRSDLAQKTRTHGNKGAAGGVAPNANSPYRTLSHFGFNSPQRDPQPDHKHIPCTTEPKKYVPLRKSISYEEIFSSPRYVDLCEYCFEKIVRLKPEIAQQTQTRLRNLCDYAGGATACGVVSAGAGARYHAVPCPGIMYQPACAESNAYDYVEYASSDTTEETLPPFSSQLEPVLEVVEEVEPDSNEDLTKKALPPPAAHAEARLIAHTPSNSSFIEKIMRLNYSEESADWNFAHAPRKVVSSTNLTLELERAILEESQREQREAHKSSPQLMETRHFNTEKESECDAPNVEVGVLQEYGNVEDVADSARRMSITEIWEFMQWQDESENDKGAVNPEHAEYAEDYAQISSSQGSGGAICFYYENARESASNRERTMEQQIQDGRKSVECDGGTGKPASPASAATSNESGTQERRRSLMTREERSRRKLVFQELWEDHISFLDGKELNSLSDTESAIDGQQEENGTSARRALEADAAAEDAGDGGVSAGREQDVSHELNAGNELFVEHTEEGNISPSLVLAVGLQSLEAEVFNSRSIILRNSTNGTTMPVPHEGDEGEELTNSETLMNLQASEVGQGASENLILSWTTEESEDKNKSVLSEDASDELQTKTNEKVISSVGTTYREGAKSSPSRSQSVQSPKTAIKSHTEDSVVELKIPDEESSYKDQTETLTRTVTKVVNLAPNPTKRVLETLQTPEDCLINIQPSSSKDELIEPRTKKLLIEIEPQKENAAGTEQTPSVDTPRGQSNLKSPPNPADKQRGSPPSMSSKANLPKAKTNKPKASNLRSKRYMHIPCAKVDMNRPATPKPQTTITKQRKLSTMDPQPTLLETVLRSRQKRGSLDAQQVSSSESEDNHSARTYDLSASRECMFFLELEMDNSAPNATPGRADCEVNSISRMTDEWEIGEELEMGAPSPNTKQSKHTTELEVAEVLVNKLATTSIERVKAGMSLPTDKQKTKPEHNTAPNIARVAQLTAEALNEPQSKLGKPVRQTKRQAHNKPTRSSSNEASTSIQAAQKRASTSQKLLYEPKVEEYVLFKQNIPLPRSPTGVIVRDEDAIDDHMSPFEDADAGEAQFAELLESDEHEDLTKLSEEFEELLLNVENLQLQAEGRERGGAEEQKVVVEGDEVNEMDETGEIEADSHLNPMERKILRKISQLKECEEIFDKIEMTIRNKVTPNQLEQLVREQSFNVDASASSQPANESQSTRSTFTASTPDRFLSANTSLADEFGSMGQSQSFSQANISNVKEAADVSREYVREPNNSCSLGDSPILDADESSTLTPNGSHNYSLQTFDSTSNAEDKPATAATKQRRSRSLTPSHAGEKRRELSPPPAKLNKTTTPPQELRKSINSARRDSKDSETSAYKTKASARTISKWPRVSSSTPEMKTSKRNFILENIRNAAIPRHTGAAGVSPVSAGGSSLGRRQGNAQAIFCKNPFGPLSAASSCSKMSNSSLSSSTTSTSRTMVKGSSSSSAPQTSRQVSPRNSSTGVYTFQSKLVRGSPRFWVSLTQTNGKKLQTQKRRRRSQQPRKERVETNDSTCSLRDYNELLERENVEQIEHVEQEMHEEQSAQVEEQIFEESVEPESREEHDEQISAEECKEEDAPSIAEECETDENLDGRAVCTVDNINEAAGELSGDDDNSVGHGGGAAAFGVQHELDALSEQIQQLEPRLDNYQNKMLDFDAHVAQCSRHMDDCIAVQADIVENQRELCEQMTLQQYAEHIMCQVQTYSISETED